jgi:hypothetical protein
MQQVFLFWQGEEIPCHRHAAYGMMEKSFGIDKVSRGRIQ